MAKILNIVNTVKNSNTKATSYTAEGEGHSIEHLLSFDSELRKVYSNLTPKQLELKTDLFIYHSKFTAHDKRRIATSVMGALNRRLFDEPANNDD